MRRTGTDVEALIDATLEGVRQVTTKQDEQINEVHGLYDRHMTSLRRIPGKTLATTGPGLGPVFSLHQLRFRESIGLVRMEGGGIVADLTTYPLPGAFFPPLDLTSPTSPSIPPNYFPQYQLPDFPQLFLPPFSLSWTPQIILPPDPVENNPDPVGDGDGCVLAVTPETIIFSFTRGSSLDDIGTVPFTVTITGTWPPLIIHPKSFPVLGGAFIGLQLKSSVIVGNQLTQSWEASINNTVILVGQVHGHIEVNVSTGFNQLVKQEIISVTAIVSPYTLSFGGALERFYFQTLGGVYSQSQTTTLTIENTSVWGSEDFTLEPVNSVALVVVSPTSGTIAAGESVPVTVTVNSLGLTGDGDHDGGSLLLTTLSGGGTATTTVPIRAMTTYTVPMYYHTAIRGFDTMTVGSSQGDFGRRDEGWAGNTFREIHVYIDGGSWFAYYLDAQASPVRDEIVPIGDMVIDLNGHFICTADPSPFGFFAGRKLTVGPDQHP